MFSIPPLDFHPIFAQELSQQCTSHRQPISRANSIQHSNNNIKLCGLSLNTGITSVGVLTDRTPQDFAPISLQPQEQCLSDTIGDTQESIKNMYNEIKWMLDNETRDNIKVILKNDKRDLVVNWVALVHTKYKFDQETFHRTINIIDKYLSIDPEIDDYELLAVTSFWIAAKIQQRKVKELKSWCKLGKTFSPDKILEMQSRILQVLNYNLIYPTSEMFLREFLINYIHLDEKSEVLCMYLLEIALMEKGFTMFKESIVAVSSVYLCFKIRRMSLELLDKTLSGFVSMNYDEIRECSRMLCRSFQKVKSSSSVYRKFSTKRFLGIAQIEVGKKSEQLD